MAALIEGGCSSQQQCICFPWQLRGKTGRGVPDQCGTKTDTKPGTGLGFISTSICFSYIRGKVCRWGMGGVTSFDVTVSDNLETCFQVRNGPFNTTKRHTHERIHWPHLLEPASTRLFVLQAREKIKIGDGACFLPIPPPGQPVPMNSIARLFPYYCFLLLGTFEVLLISLL